MSGNRSKSARSFSSPVVDGFRGRFDGLKADLATAIDSQPDGDERDALLVLEALLANGPAYASWYGVSQFERNHVYAKERAEKLATASV